MEPKTVEGTEQEAPATETANTQTVAQVDYEALLIQKDAEIAKVQEEKENYRKGMLIAKGKMPEDRRTDDGEPETAESMTRRIVQETMLSTKEAQLQAEKDAAIAALAKRNKELETALRNRSQVSSQTGEGSNQDKPEGKRDNYFSNDQLSSLKAKGWSDQKIEAAKKNMALIAGTPKI